MVSPPKLPDFIFLTFSRNPQDANEPLKITTFTILGTAAPCTRKLQTGNAVQRGVDCLLASGFVIVCAGPSTETSGYILLQRGAVENNYV